MTSQLNLLRIPISDKFNWIHLVMHSKKILFKEFTGNGTLALINRLLELLNSDIPNQTNIVSIQRKRKGP